jgi:hypothetical protein
VTCGVATCSIFGAHIVDTKRFTKLAGKSIIVLNDVERQTTRDIIQLTVKKYTILYTNNHAGKVCEIGCA